jgi:hypothetical protein
MRTLHTLVRMLGGCVLALTACLEIEGPETPAVDPNEILAKFRFSTRAVMMTVGDTLRLPVQAVAMNNTELTFDRRDIIWRSQDSAVVYVDTLGTVLARAQTTTPVRIVATYQRSGVTLADTIVVYVTLNKLSATSVRLIALDSTRVGIGDGYATFPRIRVDLYEDTAIAVRGAQLPLTTPSYVSTIFSATGGPENEPVYFVNITRYYLGSFWITASINLYGVEVRDSVRFEGLYPAGAILNYLVPNEEGEIVAGMPPSNQVLTLQPCAVVLILSAVTDRNIDIVFSDSTASSSGCAPMPESILQQGYFGLPFTDHIVGGNMTNVRPPEFMPLGVLVRRSSTIGEISWYVRDAVTKQRLLVSGTFKQVVPN